jgi:hypothetical protein
MAENSPLDRVWQVYEVTKDCFRVTNRIVRHGDEQFLANTIFIGTKENEATAQIQQSQEELNGFAVVLLWSQFERFLIDLVRAKVSKLREELPKPLAEKLHAKIEDDIEHWKMDDLLDLFKGTVDADFLGRAKQIKGYRDWGVHRNPRRLPSSKTDAQTAYTFLSQLLFQFQQAAIMTSPTQSETPKERG